MGNKLTLILGGARSGKSAFALDQASRNTGAKAFVATAQPFDNEMSLRIENHKKERSSDWVTFEEPVKLADVIREMDISHRVILIDCLTLWTSNVMLAKLDFPQEVERLITALLERSSTPIYIVTNEVGLGLVPETALGRMYRDNLGMLNRRVAEISSKVYLLVTGIPLIIKEV